MENLNASPAVEQSEPLHTAPVTQDQPTAAAASVASVASMDENAHAEAAELPQSDASAPASSTPDHPFSPTPTFDNPLAQVCDVEDCFLSEIGHRILVKAAQFISERAQETISSVLREDNGEPHDHELARMVDEGGPCPERSLQPGFYRRPQASSHEQAAAGLSQEAKDQLRSIADQFETAAAEAEVKGDTPNFEDRLVALEKDLANLRKITEYHGLRGPDDIIQLSQPQA